MYLSFQSARVDRQCRRSTAIGHIIDRERFGAVVHHRDSAAWFGEQRHVSKREVWL
jgi:hypothetical protein